jgi:hypothetical protein
LAGLVLLGVLTGGGRSALTELAGFLTFYCGVFTLVSLTLTVIAGLIATDRIILVARHRMWVQSVHRTLGIVAIACLGLHIATELAAARVGLFAALVPFTAAPMAIGLGSVAAYLMLMVMWTGIVRARFAQNDRAWLWRPLHAVAYLSWPVAVWHGLTAGRPPAVWVTASYLVLLFLTAIALGLRLSAEASRRRQQLAADRTTTEIAPVGRPIPAASGRRSSRSSGRGGGRFRWDAPPADQLWDDGPEAERRAEYRTGSLPVVMPVTAIPAADPYEADEYETDRYEAAPYEAAPYETAQYETAQYETAQYESAPYEAAPYEAAQYEADRYEAGRYAAGPYEYEPDPYVTRLYDEADRYPAEAARYEADRYEAQQYEANQYETDQYETDQYETERYEAAPYAAADPYENEFYEEPGPVYRGVASAPAPAASYEPVANRDGRHSRAEADADNPDAGLTLRDRFAARRAKIATAVEAERDRYLDDDDTPTLIDLDTRRALRRMVRQEGYDEASGRRDRYDEDVVRLRGEAR